ncbi:P-loop containing nucleoside triphosphate hydrolase protein [Melanogaster broomeanus]|nr:P-loop containing nucleoside triphosphate hydrolase protein [Melanogaster broomeanus]
MTSSGFSFNFGPPVKYCPPTSTGPTPSTVTLGPPLLDGAHTTAADSDREPVGLSDPTNNHNRKEMLDLVNRLRSTGVETDIDLPVIAVIGSQSAGKSSLIESISGITLPRSTGTCTRYVWSHPYQLISHMPNSPQRVDVPPSANWRTRTPPGSASSSSTLALTLGPAQCPQSPFRTSHNQQSEVQDRIRRAQLAILNPSRYHEEFLQGEHSSDQTEVSFSGNYVSLEISGKDLADLSFVDLPGLIASVGSAGNEKDIELVKSLVTSYIKKESCVILLTVACETDFENQGAHHLAKKYDPEGKRTVGVLTKPDRIQAGDEASWVKILRNETEPLANHWYCVKQPSSQELTKASRIVEAPSNDPVGDVLHVLSNFTRDLSRRLEGTPDEDGLLQAIRPHEEAFKHAIRATAPNFVPWAKTEPERVLPYAEFLANEDGGGDESEPAVDEAKDEYPASEYEEDVSPTDEGARMRDTSFNFPRSEAHWRTQRVYQSSQAIYIEEVLKRAQTARTRELPDNYPFVVQKAYIEQFIKRWKQPSMNLFDAIYVILKADLAKLVEKHFAHLGKGNAKQSVLMIIEWLLDVESTPTTLNTHYYSDYKDKFLSYYKGCRDGGNLLAKLKRYPTNGAVPRHAPNYQHSINKVLSGLGDLGVAAKATDLPKLLSPDPMEPALNIMAGVRGYFQVAYKRFADMVPMAIDYEIVRGLEKDIGKSVQEGLQITGPEGYDRCKALLQELSSVASQRHDLQRKLERLKAGVQELKKLM